jgi:hypothetical protein
MIFYDSIVLFYDLRGCMILIINLSLLFNHYGFKHKPVGAVFLLQLDWI